jgi:tetratricopeptide (TPR) repeat protein
MSAQPKSPQSSDEPTVVSADGTPLPEPTLEERAQVFWIENKKTILLTCALVLLVLVAKEGVLYYIDQREKAIGAEFAVAGNDAGKLRSFTSAHANHQLAGLAWLALGDVAYKDGKFAEAATAYEKAAPLTAGTAFGGRALIGKAFSQAQAGDKAKAEASFKAIAADAVQSSTVRSEARFHLAVLAVEAGRIEEGRKLIDEVQSTDLTGIWAERAAALRAGLPAAPVTAAAPAADAGADLKLTLPGSK